MFATVEFLLYCSYCNAICDAIVEPDLGSLHLLRNAEVMNNGNTILRDKNNPPFSAKNDKAKLTPYWINLFTN